MRFSPRSAASVTVADSQPVGEVPLGLTAHLGPPRPTAPIGRRSRWRRHRTRVSATVGLVCAIAGLALNSAPDPVSVYVDAAGYHIGSILLRAVGTGHYESGAVVLVSHQPSGATEAASSMDMAGVHVVGSCHALHTAEHCIFKMSDGRTLTAEDVLVSTDVQMWWQRHYSDGAGIRIDLRDRAVVPVPILLGR